MSFFAQEIHNLNDLSLASSGQNLIINTTENNIFMIDNTSLIITNPNADYMELELTPEVIQNHIPLFFQQQPKLELLTTINEFNVDYSQLSQLNKNYLSSYGIRKKTLCKNGLGKVGLKIRSVQNGVYVCVVVKNSPAAVAGLRFGDQILEINGISVSGFSDNQVNDLLKTCPVNNISVIVRDRPFERTVTLRKDSNGKLGFDFKNGQISKILKDSSADQNGIPNESHILEVNGFNVVAIKDKEIQKILDAYGQSVSITIVPKFIYKHIIQNIPLTLLRKDGEKFLMNI